MRRSLPGAGPPIQPSEWDPNAKESWFFDLVKELVNDEKWSCIVTAAVQNEAQDEETIQIYKQCVNTGLRKAVRIISMADVIQLLRSGNDASNSKREDKNKKAETKVSQSLKPPGRFPQIVELAAKHATYAGNECKLHPELMAALVKYIILSIKDDHCLQKRMEAMREMRRREQRITEKFIRDAKPYKGGEERKPSSKVSANILELDERINDEPIAGPDLYILLTDFYNELYFPQLQLINVPFLAILKISSPRDPDSPFPEPDADAGGRRKSGVSVFWENLKKGCSLPETTSIFKDIAIMEYEAPLESENRIDTYRTIFDELTWTQYSAFYISRQHQKYLRELHGQRLILSVENLDLSKCNVYNNLCDALITGEPITPLLVLYALVEQVVSGVPETESVALECQKNFSIDSVRSQELSEPVILVTPCKECRNKKSECLKLGLRDNQSRSSEENEWVETSEENSTNRTSSVPTQSEDNSTKSQNASTGEDSSRLKVFESHINKVLNERKTEKEMRDDKKWKAPSLCFHGDLVRSQTLHCDVRLFDSDGIVERFLKNSSLTQIWANYPEVTAEERAFCNFHFRTLLKISNQTEELLKIKMFFTLAMMLMIEKTKSSRNLDEGDAWGAKSEKLDVLKFDQNFQARLRGGKMSFPDYFFRTFIMGTYFRKVGVGRQSLERFLKSVNKTDTDGSQIDPVLELTGNSKSSRSIGDLTGDENILGSLYSILNCFQISNLAESLSLTEKADFLTLIQDFKFYEKLNPDLMVQRLLAAKENFNAIEHSYFAPTDTIIILMHNESDSRGIYDASESGVILTPVSLRDFYEHVYPELGDWLVEEEADHAKFMSDQAEKLKAREEKKDAEYLTRVKRYYCGMSVEKRNSFLNKEDGALPQEEKDLGDLPVKPKPAYRNKISFLGMNFTEFRVENRRKIREFYSRDGTRVNVTIDAWLYAPVQLLKVTIKRSHLSLYYHQWLGQEANSDFTYKTDSDVIFAFSKNTESETDFNYDVTISWPTGLLIQPVRRDSVTYIKQGYLSPYRRGWDIEQEVSRCFLNHGKVIVIKKNEDYDILCGSGTKYSFQSSEGISRLDIATTTGEVWQTRTKGPCKNKKILIATNKIIIGVDPNTKETFYKREDGVQCMLWPSGKLVTIYPDGTKITATPYFDEEEATVEWTEEEKLYFAELESKHRLQQSIPEPRSRTILRNSSIPKSLEKKNFITTGFVQVSCACLMEHPKYSTVCFNPSDPYIKMTMPEQLSVLMYSEGNYEVRQGRYLLTVLGSTVEFHMNCHECDSKSTVTLNLDLNDVLCGFVDFFQKEFVVYRDGNTTFQERNQEHDSEEMEENYKQEETPNDVIACPGDHSISESLEQRCFSFQRDLSGVEYLHADSFAFHCHQLPEETYFEHNTDDPNNVTHTFNSPYHRIGYENWVMGYEEKSDSLPTNLKKKDLKEFGAKHVAKNTFKYHFPKHHNYGNQQQNEKAKHDIKEPKLIVTRTVRCLSPNPDEVIQELQQYVLKYREKAVGIFNAYKSHKATDDRLHDSRYVDMRLRKIALTLSQSLQMYPHLCTNLPSTERDIHYFGHFIHLSEAMKDHIHGDLGILPNCKQIPNHFPRSSDFPCIYEENESTNNT